MQIKYGKGSGIKRSVISACFFYKYILMIKN